ncbi:MAG: SDR family oxidoreductase [Betaproteobacteria bacterium]
MKKLSGKIAWVTGAGTGIGMAAALSLSESGAMVILSGRRTEKLEEVASEIRNRGGSSSVIPLDVTNVEMVESCSRKILEGFKTIDILVNSAGMNVPERYWTNQSKEGWQKVIRANLDGIFNTVHSVMPTMRAQSDGLIINVSSWAGVYHTKLTGAAYNASKSGVIALTETINMEEGVNGIRACAICPGEVATPILDTRPIPPSKEERARMLQLDDMASTIKYVSELPKNACVNQIIISPTWNRMYVGGFEK